MKKSKKIILFICKILIMTVISFLIVRFYQGYRLFDDYKFPDQQVKEIEVFSVENDDDEISRLNYVIKDDEFREQFLSEIRGLTLKDKLFHKNTSYKRYHLAINFEDEEVKNIIMSIQEDGTIDIWGERYSIRYEGNLTKDSLNKFLELVDEVK